MAGNTRNQSLLREAEERLSLNLDERFLQLAGSLRQTLSEDIDELLQQQAAGHSPSSAELRHAVRNLLLTLVIHVLQDWISQGLMEMGLRIG